MATLTPIIALIDDDTMAALQPRVAELLALWDSVGVELDATQRILMHRNGWTPEMMAWGAVLRAAATVDLQVVRGDG